MLAQAENWVKSCKPCTLMSRREPPEPMLRARLPQAVWESVAMDFSGPYAMFGGIYIFLIVCTFSRFVIAKPVKSTSFCAIRAVLDDIYDTYGNVTLCRSDNGPPFSGREFKVYCAEKGIEATYSTPLDAQQNGSAECYMKIVKKAMSVPSVEGGDWSRSLAETVSAHNAAVCFATGVAPDALMFGRKRRRNLPILDTSVRQTPRQQISETDQREKIKHKKIADKKRAARPSAVSIGDKVVILRNAPQKGQTVYSPTEYVVIGKEHNSLTLLGPGGQTVSRTNTFVKKIHERRGELLIQGTPKRSAPLEGPEAASSEKATTLTENSGLELGGESPTETDVLPHRVSSRVKKAPVKLTDYIRLLKENPIV